MKATFLNREKNETTFTLDFSAEDFEKAIVQAYQATKNQYALDGFRKGKAPRKLIEARYGEGVFYEEAINRLITEHYPKALEELDINPVDRPSIDFDKVEKEGFAVTVKVTVKPLVEVKDYKGVTIPKQEITISDEDVEQDLDAQRRRNSRMVLVERPVQDGDTVLIDYSGFIDGEQFEGGTMERTPLVIGSGHFIPGFEDQLIGASAGDELDVNVTFPEEYHAEDLKGKPALFKVKIHEVKETELPELNDDFAKDVSEFDTLDELKADIRQRLEKNAADKIEYDGKNAAIEKVCEANPLDIPPVMIEDQVDQMLQEFEQQLRYQGLSLEQYFQYLEKDMEGLRAEMRPDAEKKVKTRLIVEGVARAENITADEEEIEKELATMAEQYRMEVDKLKEAMQGENLEYLAMDIRMRKAVDFLYENAVAE